MSQLAKLYIRGSLVNSTAKNLTKQQKTQVENLMAQVWADPELDSTKTEFCSILKRTICNEYEDKEHAMAEIQITFWRTAVDILFHSPSKDEKSLEYQKWLDRKLEVTTNPIIRRKYFKTCAYNYMRQILNENKIPMCKISKTVSGTSDKVAIELICFYLDNNPSKIDYFISKNDQGLTTFNVDQSEIPLKTLKKLNTVKQDMKENGVEININQDSIIINPINISVITKTIMDKKRTKFSSMNVQNDDENSNFQQHCEFVGYKENSEMEDIVTNDTICALNQRLNDTARKVFDILYNPPHDFLDTFYPDRKKNPRPKSAHIATWLELPQHEVDNAITIIQNQALALDIK